MGHFNFIHLEETGYQKALEFQELLFNDNLQKKAAGKTCHNTLIFLEHSAVYTLGKSGDINNLKVDVSKIGAEYYATNRGGDITFHGPGQLVGYPIFDLAQFNLGVRDYVHLLEECIIELCERYHVKCGRIKSASGVWVDHEGSQARKICALGIKISRGISMHGFAFNICTDLSYFENMIPCGIADKGVTSLSKEVGKNISVEEVSPQLLKIFKNKFAKIKKA